MCILQIDWHEVLAVTFGVGICIARQIGSLRGESEFRARLADQFNESKYQFFLNRKEIGNCLRINICVDFHLD